jgi:hypothetical protein
VERELRFGSRRFGGLLQERAERFVNTVFVSFLPELLKLSLKTLGARGAGNQ